MASNLTNQSRNVLSKKVMVKKDDSMDNITLFSIITVMSFFMLAPVAVFMEGVKLTPEYLISAGLNVKQIYTRSLLTTLCFHAYQQGMMEPQTFNSWKNLMTLGEMKHYLISYSQKLDLLQQELDSLRAQINYQGGASESQPPQYLH